MSSTMLEDSLIEKREAAFLQLKPLCVSLLKSVTISKEKVQEIIQTTNKLYLTLKSIPDVSVVLDYNLIQYILVPLLKLYSSLQNSDRFLEEFLNCIQFLLSTSWHNYMMPEQFKQLLVLLVRIIGGGSSVSPKTKENQNIPEFSISEETKLAGVKCILELLPKKSENYNDITNSDNFQLPIRNELLLIEIQEIHLRAVVGRCVYVLIEIISTERYLQLRLTTIETLQQLIKCIENPGIVAAFLPGILSTLSKVIIRDQKENHLLSVKIVEALMNIIYSVMNDEINKNLFSKTNSLFDLKEVWINSESSRNHDPSFKTNNTSSNTSQSQSPGSIHVERTKSWLKATKAQIKILIGSIFTIRNHPSWQLRLEFVKFSFKLLFYCTNSLDTCTSILIETLVFYLNDDNEQVSNLCREHLEVIRENSNFDEILIPILKENLNTWLTSLPRYLVGLDENAKYNALSLIVGFVYLLGSEVQTVLNNLLERVSDGLLNSLEFYIENIHIIEDRLLIGQYENLTEENENLQLQKFSRPQFKHIREQRVISTILTMFRLLGYFGNIEFLIDHFLTYVRNPDSERFHAQCIFIINEILLGASGIDINSDLNLVKMVPTNTIQEVKRISKYVLKEYIEIELMPRTLKKSKEKSLIKSNKHQIVEFVDESLQNMNIESQNRSILSNCLILEGIAYISRIMAMEFRTELNESLYPILEKVGQINSRIHNTADITLYHISVWCGYSSKKALILENIDYLINVASRKLNNIHLNPQTPLMLTAMIMIVGPPVLPYLDDSIEEIFDALDYHHMNSYLLSSLALVLYSVVRIISDSCEREQININKDKYIENNNNNVSSTKNLNTRLSEEITEFIENFSLKKTRTNVQEKRATLEEIEQYFLEHHRSKEKSESQEPQDKKPKPTQLQSTCLKIIDKVLPFLSSSSPRIRILILDMMRLSLPVLQSITHELYPLIHRIWPFIVNRLKDKEQIVILGATRLIQSIASTCGDFFASRVVDNMWPTFQELLSQQVIRDQEFLNYEFSQSHLIKKSILETMKVVIHRVSLSNQILSEIINTMYPFLSKEIHEDHQNSAIELFKELTYRNSNNAWLILRGLDENYIVWPKHLCKYPKGDKKDQYSRNVQILLDEIDKIT
ncbi:7515_t:CDS:2 [Diversispora eburnea]|uniref:7515_t:CDS:1 n=1 Tax=Diversispora eburnea TaxID=1213867 RepID=A0A9N8YPE4_9GLOM|nr:7515_t:CDS:2 [Diversispora eburnea]